MQHSSPYLLVCDPVLMWYDTIVSENLAASIFRVMCIANSWLSFLRYVYATLILLSCNFL
jgi:hypothetical protein